MAVMGYRNSVPYIQRQMDLILKDVPYTRAYLDDILVVLDTLDDHIEHLHNVFRLFQTYNIALEPKKAFVGFLTVDLLG